MALSHMRQKKRTQLGSPMLMAAVWLALTSGVLAQSAQSRTVPATAAAQRPTITLPTITLNRRFTPGKVRHYEIVVRSDIQMNGASGMLGAHLLQHCRVEERDLKPDKPGEGKVALRYQQYSTQVSSDDPGFEARLRQRAGEEQAKVAQMGAIEIEVLDHGAIHTLAAPKDEELDQALTILQQFAYADLFPNHAVAPGAHWSRIRVQHVSSLHTSVPLQMKCVLAEVHGDVATIDMDMTGSTALPPSSLGLSPAELAGKMVSAEMTIVAHSQNQYRIASGVLQQSTSQSTNTLQLTIAGPVSENDTTTIHSSGTVKLVP